MQLIAGERRLAAARAEEQTVIPVIVRGTLSDTHALTLAAVENMHRLAMTPIDEARLIRTMLTSGRLNQADVARELGRAPSWVSSRLSLLDPAGTKTPMPGYLDGYVDRMAPAAARLHNVSLESRPALQLVEDGRSPGVLIYADPPYLGSTRKSGRYKHEMLAAADHEQLADALRAASAAVVVSGYDSPLYDRLYSVWDRVAIPTTTGQGGTRQDRVEVLWSNRPIAQPTLFDHDDRV